MPALAVPHPTEAGAVRVGKSPQQGLAQLAGRAEDQGAYDDLLASDRTARRPRACVPVLLVWVGIDTPAPSRRSWRMNVRFGYASLAVGLVACNGSTVDTDALDTGNPVVVSTGPVVLTEILAAPMLGEAEWVELSNVGDTPVDLSAYTLEIDGTAFPLDGELAPAGVYLVASVDTAIAPQLTLPDLDLPDDRAIVRVLGPDGEEDWLDYGPLQSTGSAMPIGASISLHPATDPTMDAAFDWCDGWSAFGGSDFGTPGEPNESCARSFGFDFDFDNGTSGSTILELFAGSREGATADGGELDVERRTTASGQTLSFTYRSTGLSYEGTRDFGSDCFDGGTATNGVVDGTWDVPDCI
jgi:hypothetical protein